METLRGSRNPTTVVTDNGEVLTNGEAQVHVHDLDLFVTVQLLDDTPAVLSLGKLCEEHGCACEYASGQKPHLTKQGRIFLQNGKFRTSCCPWIVVKWWHQFVFHITTAGPRKLVRFTKNSKQNFLKRDTNRASDERLRDLPEWLEEFAEILEDTEVPEPAHTSHDSDSERLTKEAPRKHSIFTHFPKDRNSEACLRTKMTRAPCRRRTGEAAPRAEKCGDLITVDHKVLNEVCESRDNHRYAVLVQDLAR